MNLKTCKLSIKCIKDNNLAFRKMKSEIRHKPSGRCKNVVDMKGL